MNFGIFYRVAVIFMAALLASCAQNPFVGQAELPSLSGSERYVLVSFSEDGELPPGNWGQGSWKPSLIYRKIGSDQDLNIPNYSWTDEFYMSSDLSETRGYVYVLALEPGEYEIYNWRRTEANQYAVSTYEAENLFSHRFTVKPEGVSYLGEIRMTALTGRNFMGATTFGGFNISYSDELQRDLRIAKGKYPQVDFSNIQKTLISSD